MLARARHAARALRGARGRRGRARRSGSLQRAEIEGRSDDNEETIRNRMRVYREQTAAAHRLLPRARACCVEIDGVGSVDEVGAAHRGGARGVMASASASRSRPAASSSAMREAAPPRRRDPARAARSARARASRPASSTRSREKAIRSAASSRRSWATVRTACPPYPGGALRLGERGDRARHPRARASSRRATS